MGERQAKGALIYTTFQEVQERLSSIEKTLSDVGTSSPDAEETAHQEPNHKEFRVFRYMAEGGNHGRTLREIQDRLSAMEKTLSALSQSPLDAEETSQQAPKRKGEYGAFRYMSDNPNDRGIERQPPRPPKR